MNTILTRANLDAGIKAWQDRPSFDADFHNRFYKDLELSKSRGLSIEWWEYIIDELARWKATRGEYKAVIRKRGLDRLTVLRDEYARIMTATKKQEPDLETVSWEVLSGSLLLPRPSRRVSAALSLVANSVTLSSQMLSWLQTPR